MPRSASVRPRGAPDGSAAIGSRLAPRGAGAASGLPPGGASSPAACAPAPAPAQEPPPLPPVACAPAPAPAREPPPLPRSRPALPPLMPPFGPPVPTSSASSIFWSTPLPETRLRRRRCVFQLPPSPLPFKLVSAGGGRLAVAASRNYPSSQKEWPCVWRGWHHPHRASTLTTLHLFLLPPSSLPSKLFLDVSGRLAAAAALPQPPPPPRSAAVATKTPASTALAGAKKTTIN
jgi:hypothetical protein